MNQQPTLDSSLLSAALQGLELQRQRIEQQISQVRSMLGGRATPSTTESADGAHRPRRRFSLAARRRMAAAQRRRYAAARGEVVTESPATAKAMAGAVKPKKRRISADGLANIRAAQMKRRAAEKKAAAVETRVAATKAAKKSAAKRSVLVASKKAIKSAKAVNKASAKVPLKTVAKRVLPKPEVATESVQAAAAAE